MQRKIVCDSSVDDQRLITIILLSRSGRTRNGELSLSLQEGGVGIDELAGLVIELVISS